MGDPSLAPSHVYVLAQICMNASPSNQSREVWKQSVLPQLDYNGEALRKTLAGDAITLPSGAVMSNVTRLDSTDSLTPCRVAWCSQPAAKNFCDENCCCLAHDREARQPILLYCGKMTARN